MTVVLCGTGSPLADQERAGACTAVIAGGELVLVDVGPGSWETLDLTNVPTGELSAVLLTHFHSDHIGDLGEAMTQSWIAGRDTPLDVYGPVGTKQVVDGFDAGLLRRCATTAPCTTARSTCRAPRRRRSRTRSRSATRPRAPTRWSSTATG